MNSIDERIQWFQDARFGLFLHWGLYSVLAGEWQGQRMDTIGEWIMSRFRIPRAEYEKLALQFNPQGFDANEWAAPGEASGYALRCLYGQAPRGFCHVSLSLRPL